MRVGEIFLIIISGLGIFHGLFLAIILFTAKTPGNISNRILGWMMLVLSLRVAKSVIMAFTGKLPIIYVYLGLCLMLFIGPLFLLYGKALLYRTRHIRLKDLTHFVPAILFMFLAVPMQWTGFGNIPDLIAGLLFAIFYLHFLGYVLFVKRKVIEAGASRPPDVITWLNILFFGLLAIWLEYVLNLFEDQVPYILGPIVYSVTVYYITYLAFRHKYLTVINTVKYQTAGINEAEINALYASLENLMQQEKIFLDPNLTLATLGKRLKVNSQKLSMAVNSRSGANFNEYTNKYRIAHAKKILKDQTHSNLNIAAIAYDCGFNSLSTFNSAFKKVTGKTPSWFRNAND